MFSAPILLTAALAACLWPTDQSGEGALSGLSMDPQAPPMDTTLVPSTDTWTWHSHPNDNLGTTADLRSGVGGNGRAFLRWDPQAIQDAVGSMTLLMARIEVTVQTSTGWSGSGGQVGLYRMTTDWTELGATDNCAIDAVPGNGHADCSGATAWSLHDPAQAPWVVPPTDSVFLTNGQTGTVTFDVRADVAAFLAGTGNYGWALKPTNDAAAADVRVGSRESASPPVLVLTISADTGRPPVPYGFDSPDSAAALLTSPPGNDSVLVLLNFVHIEFDDSTSGATVLAVFNKYSAEVAGGFPLTGTYIARIPDPGSTYEALDSVMAAIRLEPGVRGVYRYVYREPIRDPGRYPIDGAAVQRADWLTGQGSDGTRGLRAIRAPLAWGCENGAYGGADPIAIGIIDNIFANVPDLAGFISDSLPVDTVVWPLRTDTISDFYQSHGTGVAGVMTASADNGLDVAGVLWQSSLHAFPLASETPAGVREVENRGAYVRNVVIPTAAAAQIRILHSSIEAEADTALATLLARAVAAFLGASPEGRLFIQASTNYRDDFTAAQINALSQGSVLMQQVAVRLAADPLTRVRFIHVGAANRDGTDIWDDGFAGGSTLISGVTDIIAPGEDILTLVRPQDFGGATTILNGAPGGLGGTSWAAPMVSGVAGLLWAFHPTMTADGIKTYILKGAQQRITGTGTLATVPPVPNSGGLHLLDAYGALAHVARDSSSTPVCGFPVFARNDAVFQVRSPGDTQTIPVPVPTGTDLANVSVAPGGRLLAVTDLTGGEEVVQFTPTGQTVGSPRPLLRRQFLERDTLDWTRSDANGDTWIILRREDGTVDSLNAAALTFPNPVGPRFTAEVEGSPAGDWVAVRTIDAGTQTHRWDLLDFVERVPQNVATIVRSSPLDCTDCEGHFVPERLAGWSHDGQRALFAFPLADRSGGALVALRTRAQRIPVIAGAPNLPGQTDLIQNVIVKRPRFTADDAVLIWNELDLGSLCYRATRVAAAPTQVVGTPALVDIQECDLGDAGPTIFNAPPAAITTEVAAPRRSGRTPRPARQ